MALRSVIKPGPLTARRSRFDQVMFDGEAYQLTHRMHSQLAHDVGTVRFSGLDTDPEPDGYFFAAVFALGRVVNCVGKQSSRGLGIEFTEIDANDKKRKGWSMDIDNFRARSHSFLDHGNVMRPVCLAALIAISEREIALSSRMFSVFCKRVVARLVSRSGDSAWPCSLRSPSLVPGSELHHSSLPPKSQRRVLSNLASHQRHSLTKVIRKLYKTRMNMASGPISFQVPSVYFCIQAVVISDSWKLHAASSAASRSAGRNQGSMI